MPGANCSPACAIKVVGIGGAGCNAVAHMISKGAPGAEFIVMNTDEASLQRSVCRKKLLLYGLDTAENRRAIYKALSDAGMAVLVAGLGGKTGSGVAPAVAQICKESGIPIECLVTTPLAVEGPGRMKVAQESITKIRCFTDKVKILSLNELKQTADKTATIADFFEAANEMLCQRVRNIVVCSNPLDMR